MRSSTCRYRLTSSGNRERKSLENQRGIVAKIAQAIADAGGDIVDISQTLVSDYFTMIIIVDTGALSVSFAEFKTRLERTVGGAGAECLVMHEDVVNALQRV